MCSFIVSLATVAAFLVPGSYPQADETAAYTVLDDGAAQLREDFNRAKGSVRLLFVVDPICPGCLRGLDDINKALLGKTDDPRLQTFVVHVPVLGPEAKDVGPAAKLVQNSYVRHYWNPSGSFGWELTESAGLEDGAGEPVYAWDVWLIYGPEATWDGALPPQPRHLMHNLWALQDSEEFRRLDSEVLTQEVEQLLAQLPAADSAQ